MKIKKAIIAATILAAAIITSVKAIKDSSPLFELNVEALTEVEIQGRCESSIKLIECGTVCSNCKRIWTAQGVFGEYVRGSGVCICGYTM